MKHDVIKTQGNPDKVKMVLVALLCLVLLYAGLPLSLRIEAGYSQIVWALSLPSILVLVCVAYRKYVTAITASFALLFVNVLLDASLLKTVEKGVILNDFLEATSEWSNDKSQDNLKRVAAFREKGLGVASAILLVTSVQAKDLESAVESIEYAALHHSGMDLYHFARTVKKYISSGELEKSMITDSAYTIIQDSLNGNEYLLMAEQLTPTTDHLLKSIKSHARLLPKS